MHTMVVQMSIDPSRAHVVTRHLREDIVSWARQQAGIHQRPVAAGPGPKPRHGRRCLRLRARRHSRGARPTQLPPRPRPGLERRGRDRLRAGHLRLTAHRPARPVCEATGDVRRVSRFPGRDHFAAYSCTAPIEVSSGGRKVHRLSRRGNRRLNHAIHLAAVTQILTGTVRAAPTTTRSWPRARPRKRYCAR